MLACLLGFVVLQASLPLLGGAGGMFIPGTTLSLPAFRFLSRSWPQPAAVQAVVQFMEFGDVLVFGVAPRLGDRPRGEGIIVPNRGGPVVVWAALALPLCLLVVLSTSSPRAGAAAATAGLLPTCLIGCSLALGLSPFPTGASTWRVALTGTGMLALTHWVALIGLRKVAERRSGNRPNGDATANAPDSVSPAPQSPLL